MKTFICLSLQSSVRSYSKQARSSELKLKSKFKSLFINQNVLIRIKTTSKTTHTLLGHRRSIHDEILRRTCDLYCDNSAASRVQSENRADEFSCDAGLWLGEKTVCTPNRLLIHSLYTTSGFVSLSFEPADVPPQTHRAGSVHPSDVVLFVRRCDQTPCRRKKLAVSYAKVNHCPVICNVCVCVCLSELFLTTSPDKWGRVESGREENFKKKNWIRRMQDCGNTCLILV